MEICSGVIAQLIAVTLASICSGLVAPAIMLATVGRVAIQLKANSRRECPCSFAKEFNFSTIESHTGHLLSFNCNFDARICFSFRDAI